MYKSRAIALGIVAAIVVACGIIMSVLLHFLVVTMVDGYKTSDLYGDNEWSSLKSTSNNNMIWVCGMVYIVPGVLGFVAAFVQNKCLYVTSCIFSMISLLIMGLLFFFAGFAIIVMIIAVGSISEQCKDTPDGCTCLGATSHSYDDSYNDTMFRSCDYFSKFASLVIALLAIILIAWITMLAQFILACYYACRSKPESSQGVVFTPAQQPMMPPSAQHYPPPPYGNQPQPAYYDDPPPSKM